MPGAVERFSPASVGKSGTASPLDLLTCGTFRHPGKSLEARNLFCWSRNRVGGGVSANVGESDEIDDVQL